MDANYLAGGESPQDKPPRKKQNLFWNRWAELSKVTMRKEYPFITKFSMPQKEQKFTVPYFKQGRVSHIYVWESGSSRSFTLSKLLSNYGKPDEIKIQVYREVFDGYPTFTMLIIYRAQGIVAEYLTVAEKDGSYIKGCFQSGVEYGRGPSLWLFDTNDPALADLDFFIPRTKAEPISPPVLSIEQAAGMDIQVFHQKYKDIGNQCIFTPVTLWPDIRQMIATATAMASAEKHTETPPAP